MRACVFVRRSGAFGLGHVGWAFEQGNGLFYTGSVENPSGSPVEHPSKIGFWSVKTKDPVSHMAQRDYDTYKICKISGGNHVRAYSKVLDVKKAWYTLLFGNCMDDTYNVLKEYGVPGMPLPGTSITPNNWYDSLKNWSEYQVGGMRSASESTDSLELLYEGEDDFEDLSDASWE